MCSCAGPQSKAPSPAPEPNPVTFLADPVGCVGQKCKILWPDDDTWYEGVVRAYNSATRQHNVWYYYDEQVRAERLARYKLDCMPSLVLNGNLADGGYVSKLAQACNSMVAPKAASLLPCAHITMSKQNLQLCLQHKV